jgi:hypothetical protein
MSVALFGCGGDDAAPDAGIDASPACAEALTHSDLAWIQEKVFTPQCSGFNACHKGAATMAGGLSLEAGMARGEMVGIASTRFPTQTLVVPGNPAASYLLVAVGQYPGMIDPRIGTMPFNSPLLCREKRDAIERWIVAGAPM